MNAVMILGLLSAFAVGNRNASASSVVDGFNPLIGTAAEGQTFPATGVPFGMTQWTPQTRDKETKCIAPYYSADTRIQGFRGSHFMSGSCTQDYGSVTLMPMTGPLKVDAVARSSAFTHGKRNSTPYRYQVHLTDYDIDARMTGTSHTGILRFQFGRPGQSWILVEDNSRPGEGNVTVDLARGEISGVNPAHRLYAGSGKPAGFSGYFVVRFDHPFTTSGTWSGMRSIRGASNRRPWTGRQALSSRST